MTHPFHTEQLDGATIELHYDEMSDHPRQDGDWWALSCRRESDWRTLDEAQELAREAAYRGVTAWGDPRETDGEGLDGPGYCYVTPETAAEWGWADEGDDFVAEQIAHMLDSARAWAEGEVAGWVVTLDDGTEESCWGYYPEGTFGAEYAYALSEARETAESMVADARTAQEAARVAAWAMVDKWADVARLAVTA